MLIGQFWTYAKEFLNTPYNIDTTYELYRDLRNIHTNPQVRDSILNEDSNWGSFLEKIMHHFEVDLEAWRSKVEKLATTEWEQLPEMDWYKGTSFSAYYQLLYCITLPHISTEDPTRIAYYINTDHILQNRETRTTYGRMINAALYVDDAVVTKAASEFNALVQDVNCFVLNHSQMEEWGKAFTQVKSCMSNDDYAVATYNTWRCYLTQHYGLPDNNLRLFVVQLNGNDKPYIGRAIVDIKNKTYVKCYGSETTKEHLKAHGYSQVSDYEVGTTLAAIVEDGIILHPYVDSDGDVTHAYIEYDPLANQQYWALNDCGEETLVNTTELCNKIEDFDLGTQAELGFIPPNSIVSAYRWNEYSIYKEHLFTSDFHASGYKIIELEWYKKVYPFFIKESEKKDFISDWDNGRLLLNHAYNLMNTYIQDTQGEFYTNVELGELIRHTVRITDLKKLCELNQYHLREVPDFNFNTVYVVSTGYHKLIKTNLMFVLPYKTSNRVFCLWGQSARFMEVIDETD